VTFDHARKIADAVLYEGYVLYPYRASARKNRLRWQFGVLAPRSWSEAGGGEAWWMQTTCLVEPGAEAHLTGRIRFLHVLARTVEEPPHPGSETFRPVEALDVGGRLWTSWEEGAEREVDFAEPLPQDGSRAERVVGFAFPGDRRVESIRDEQDRLAGRVVRTQRPIEGAIRLSVDRVAGSRPLLAVRIRVENLTPLDTPGAPRAQALGTFLVGTHALLAVQGGEFVSLLDHPPWAAAAAAACENVRTWPVLVGPEGSCDVVLSSPIILQDHPEIAPESAGDLFDATEIDEILTLRTMTLTEEEKREARATDPRAAEIIDRVDTMPAELLERLHGAVRSLRPVTTPAAAPAPWWDPGVDASVSPETDQIEVAGVAVARGSRVRLCPGARRSDAQDMFLAGRVARVEGVFLDVEDKRYLAVTLEEDPAAELHQWHGRYLYFAPDEVEPLESRP
jgi:hypothetical protein